MNNRQNNRTEQPLDLTGLLDNPKYVVKRKLHDSFRSTLYLAGREADGSEVVVKHYKEQSDASQREQKIQQILAQYPQHDNILHSIAFTPGHINLGFFPYVRGRNLKRLFKGKKLLPKKALGIMSGLCDGLEHLHSLGIVHRDVKLENVLVQADEQTGKYELERAQIKLFDFDVSWHKDIADMDMYGRLYGTPSCIAPEACLGEHANLRWDIYAAGIILFELLAGQHPFPQARTVTEVMKAHVEAEVPDITLFNHYATRDQNHVLKKALAKDPHHRHQSAREFKEDCLSVVDRNRK